MKFNNLEDGIKSAEIGETRDFIIYNPEDEKYYYWLESTHPTNNYGPFDTVEEALEDYNKNGGHQFVDDDIYWED